MTAPPASCRVPKPPPSTAERLPDFVDLDDAPQLGPIALLQVALQVTTTALDLHHPSVASLREAVVLEPDCPSTLLAQLVCDRCGELYDLLVCYRLALSSPARDGADSDVF